MRLSELVALRNQIDQLSVIPAKTSTEQEFNKIKYASTLLPQEFAQFQTQINTHADQIYQGFEQFETTLTCMKTQIQLLIEQEEKQWFQKSYNLYDREMRKETPEYILNRREKISVDTKELFNSRLKIYTDWRFPGLVIRPGLEKFVDTMVSNDPLYLVDQHRDLLTPAQESFADAYQRRLRCYVVNEHDNNNILERLPDSQFGLCLAYYFFNFRPIEVIRQWLTELHTKLRPGGVLLLTINDCDRESGVVLAESGYACYTPGRLVMTLAESLGYEIVYVWNDWGPMTWIELRKSGVLTSMRGGQTLAKIVSKSVANSK